MPRPIVIKDEPERFRIFWIAGDNYKNSDDQKGVIKSEKEIERSIKAACEFSSSSPGVAGKTTGCLDFIDHAIKTTGYDRTGFISFFRGYAYYQNGEFKRSAEYFDLATKQGADAWIKDAGLFYDCGTACLQARKFEAAISCFEKAIRLGNKDPMLKIAIMVAKTMSNLEKGGTVVKKTSLPDETLAGCHGDKECEKGLKRKHLSLKDADAQIVAGRYELAAARLKWVLNNLIEDPQISATYHALASYSAFMLGHIKEAVFHSRQLIVQLKDAGGLSKAALLSCFFKLKDDPKSALEHFEKLEQKDLFAERKDFIMTRSLIILIKFFSTYSKVSRGQTKDPKLYMFVGSFLLTMGRFQESLECFNSYIKLLPDNYMGYLRRSYALDMMHRYPEALESIKKAISLNKKEAWLFSLYGLILAHLDRYKEAIEQYDIARRMDPKLYEPLIRKCIALANLNDKQGGGACIEKVIKEHPGIHDMRCITDELLLEKRHLKEKANMLKRR